MKNGLYILVACLSCILLFLFITVSNQTSHDQINANDIKQTIINEE